MTGFILSFFVGVLCIVLGILNTKGNISSLHSYHRHRVSPEDVLPFGKKVGLGMIIIGSAIVLFSALSTISLYTEKSVYTLLGTVVLISGLVVGLGITFYAMIKYNKGIF